MPKVSIVIPAYNAEKTLTACLDSALSRTLRDIEDICVNDGAVDDTEFCIERYMRNDSRVRCPSFRRNSKSVIARKRGVPDGAVRPVAGGDAGMEQFRIQQRKRKRRRFAMLLLSPFRPLKFLRIPARTETRFRDGTVQWNFGRIPVAARTPEGKTVYQHWSKRLFFRIPESPGREGRLN